MYVFIHILCLFRVVSEGHIMCKKDKNTNCLPAPICFFLDDKQVIKFTWPKGAGRVIKTTNDVKHHTELLHEQRKRR